MSRAKNLANFQTTITDGTTSVATSFVTNGSAKSWMSLTGTGTISVDDSLNISTAVDNGTGDYSQNYSSAFNSGTKSLVMSGGYWTFNAEIDGVPAASSDIFQCKDGASSFNARDADVFNTSVCGNLA